VIAAVQCERLKGKKMKCNEIERRRTEMAQRDMPSITVDGTEREVML
jgi:hypothetical protein